MQHLSICWCLIKIGQKIFSCKGKKVTHPQSPPSPTYSPGFLWQEQLDK